MQEGRLHILTLGDALPGDVVLCYARETAEKASEATGLAYSHAGICVDGGTVAEATTGGVRKTPLADLLQANSHLVLLRQPDCWSADRIETLGRLVEEVIVKAGKFNTEGIRRFEARRRDHEIDLMQKLPDYFEGKLSAPDGKKDRYFCSEFVASMYVQVGIIEPSAALVYDPAVISPAHLVDATFGWFLGYLVPYPTYQIPADDKFLHATPMHEILQEDL